MSFWDSLFGKSQKKDITRADTEAARLVDEGQKAAEAELERGRSSITGYGDTARTDIDAGAVAAREKLAGGYTAAEGTAGEYLGNALAYLKPYVESGGKSQKLFDDLQGLNGPEAQQAAVATYQANPYLAQEQERTAKLVDRQFRARGMADSGRAALASARATEELGYKDYTAWRGDVEEAGVRGGAYAGQAAQFTSNTGDLLAKLRAQRGESEAGIETGVGQSKAAISQNTGNALAGISGKSADLKFGAATTQAGRVINTGNALAANRLTGFNNLLKIGGVVAQAYGGGLRMPSGGVGG